jgi:nucleotide-binding universal stress UspA family protein
MKRFKKLLAVLNGGPGDRQVTRRAVALAKANKAQLMFCATQDVDPQVGGVFRLGKLHAEIDRLVRKERQAILDAAVRKARARRQPARARVLEGRPFVAIIREVLRDERDLVLFPEDRDSSTTSLLFGSTATHLLRKCPCPVWVLKETSRGSGSRSFKRVLAAINAGTKDPVEVALNVKILELATSLAQREGAEIHVVHSWSVYGESLLSGRGRIKPEELTEYRRQTRQTHRKALEEALAPFVKAGHEIREHMPKGDPGKLIPHVAENISADVVVMGTVARTGIEGVFIGNTAEHVLQQIGRSVLAVKPDGFVSPVGP